MLVGRERISQRCVAYINPRFSNSAENENDLVDRFSKYAEDLDRHSEKSKKLVLLLGSNIENLNQSPNLIVERVSRSTLNVITFAIRARRKFRILGTRPSILVAGDLTVGFLASYIISRTYLRRIPIQISIHGNHWNFMSEKPNTVFQLLMRKYLRLISTKAKSIRVVSPGLKKSLLAILGGGQDKIFVAPVPIVPLPEFLDKRKAPICIAIVGRLHPERAPLDSIKIIMAAFAYMPPCPVLVIGNGPLLNAARELVAGSEYVNYFQFLGSRSRSSILELWPSINLLISSAYEEGYGLANREALISGAIVLCRRNSGTLEFSEMFKDGVVLFDSLSHGSDELLRIASSITEIENNSVARKIQLELDESAIRTLIGGWSVN